MKTLLTALLVAPLLLSLNRSAAAGQHLRTFPRPEVPVLAADTPVPLGLSANETEVVTAWKVVGATGGTIVGGLVGITAAVAISGDAEDIGAAGVGMVLGGTLGAALGAYIPGETPEGTFGTTLGIAALGTLAGIAVGLVVPPLAVAGPPVGALVGFSMAYPEQP